MSSHPSDEFYDPDTEVKYTHKDKHRSINEYRLNVEILENQTTAAIAEFAASASRTSTSLWRYSAIYRDRP